MDPVRYLEATKVEIFSIPNSVHLRVELAGDRCILAASVYRCFPLTSPDEFLSVQDSSGAEVGILRSLTGLSSQSRAILDSYMDRRYFTPQILKIHGLEQDASMWLWQVSTQRGAATFYIRGVRDSVHEVAPKRWQIHSIDGQRFEIRDFEELDAKSQDLFEGLF